MAEGSWTRTRRRLRLPTARAALLALAVGLLLAASAQAQPGTGNFYVTNVDGTGPGYVIRVDASTGARTLVSRNANPAGPPDFVDPWGIAVEANGQILVVDSGRVIRVDPSTGVRTRVSENGAPAGAPNFAVPWGMVEEAAGTIAVADQGAFGGDGGVIRVDPATGVRTTVSENAAPPGAPNFNDATGIALVRPILVIAGVNPPGFGVDSGGPSEDPEPPGSGDRPPGQNDRRAAGTSIRRGTRFTYDLSEPARVLFRIDRRLRGRIEDGRCRKETRKNRKRPRCTRWATVGAFAHQGKKGRNRKSFSGKIGRKALQPGRYRTVLIGRTPAGHTTLPTSREFRVLRG